MEPALRRHGRDLLGMVTIHGQLSRNSTLQTSVVLSLYLAIWTCRNTTCFCRYFSSGQCKVLQLGSRSAAFLRLCIGVCFSVNRNIV